MASKFPKNAGDFGKFEFTEHAFGADETRDSPPSPNVDGGITLHPAAAFCSGPVVTSLGTIAGVGTLRPRLAARAQNFLTERGHGTSIAL
jgi:hypothetical protein